MFRLQVTVGFIAGLVIGMMLLAGNGVSDDEAASPMADSAVRIETFRSWGTPASVGTFLVPRWAHIDGDTPDALISARGQALWIDDGREDTVGVAIKLTMPGPGHSPLLGRLVESSHWNLFWPGTGSAFASGSDNVWPVSRDAFRARLAGDRAAAAVPVRYRLTRQGEGAGGTVIGSTGQFEGRRGWFAEIATHGEFASGDGSAIVEFNQD